MINISNVDALIGADVIDREDRKIGTVGQIYLDSATDQPSWVTIKTGLFGTGESFAPLDRAEWAGQVLRVPYDKGFVKDAPRIDADGALDRADEEALYRYYGMSSGAGTTRTETTGTTATTGTTGTGRERRPEG